MSGIVFSGMEREATGIGVVDSVPMTQLELGALIDPTTHERSTEALTLPSAELTTHAVIVGMTGSGKTGLGVVLLEEVLSAGVGALIIDPKGDLPNLGLLFPGFTAEEFEPWVDPGEAARSGTSVHDAAAAAATSWKEGLASWNVGPDRLIKLGTSVGFTVYTPGSSAGVGLNLIGSLAAPVGADPETLHDEIEGFVSGLLGLVGVDADPLSSREHILLSNLIADAWGRGQSLDLATLIGLVQTPPLRKLGVFDLDTFFPPKDRTKLALTLNGLLASPSFASWTQGQPVDIDTLLRTADGRPRAAIVSVAHLNDAERQFVVSLLLNKMVTWMRRQPGTSELRALVYLDEAAGYLPPSAIPPTKKPLMTLFKQARAFGVGVVVSTQNPVDIDYKAISNAGTWMIGRLQTEQDQKRLLDGLESATTAVDRAALSSQLGNLGKRQFVLRRASQNEPVVFTSRWSMSYLRGPVTREQIATLMADQKAALPPPVATTATAATAEAPGDPGVTDGSGVAPPLASGIPAAHVDPAAPWLSQFAGAGAGPLRAAAVARVNLLFDDTKAQLRETSEWEAVIFPLSANLNAENIITVDYDDRDLTGPVPANARYESPDAPIAQTAWWTQLKRDLTDHLVRNQTTTVRRNLPLKLYSRPGETEESFVNRCKEAAEEQADAETAKLRDKYEAKITRQHAVVGTARDRVDVAKSQARGSQGSAVLSAAGSLLGGLLGGKKRSSTLASMARSAGGLASKAGTAATAGQREDSAENRLSQEEAELAELDAELADELTKLTAKWDEVAATIDSIEVPLEKADVSVSRLSLVWLPSP